MEESSCRSNIKREKWSRKKTQGNQLRYINQANSKNWNRRENKWNTKRIKSWTRDGIEKVCEKMRSELGKINWRRGWGNYAETRNSERIENKVGFSDGRKLKCNWTN